MSMRPPKVTWTYTPDAGYLRHVYPDIAGRLEEVVIEEDLKNLDYKYLYRSLNGRAVFAISLTSSLLMELSPTDRAMNDTFEWFSFYRDTENGMHILNETVRAFVQIYDLSNSGSRHQVIFAYTIHGDNLSNVINIALSGLQHFSGIRALPIRKEEHNDVSE